MSEATLFSFGAVIFVIVFTGATLFGMASLKEFQDPTNSGPLAPLSDCPLVEMARILHISLSRG